MKNKKNVISGVLFLVLILFSPVLGILSFILYAWIWSGYEKRTKVLITVSVICMFLLLLAPIFNLSPIYTFQVNGKAFEPNLPDDSYILTTPLNKKSIKKDDVVIINAPYNSKKHISKRVIGMPGEKILLKNGEIFVNSQKLQSPYFVNEKVAPGEYLLENKEIQIPTSSYFVIGDNHSQSEDSRKWGVIHIHNIHSKMILCYKNCSLL